jgi:general secretion pathway protein D
VEGTPSFSKRTAQTAVVVEDGQSLLIGGIISSIKRFERSGLPWLSKLPILGYLFGTTSESEDRTELFIMLTPHVIANPEEGRIRTEEFTRRLDWLEDLFKRGRLPSPPPNGGLQPGSGR